LMDLVLFRIGDYRRVSIALLDSHVYQFNVAILPSIPSPITGFENPQLADE
jgi:hypothetical protein